MYNIMFLENNFVFPCWSLFAIEVEQINANSNNNF